MAKDLSDFLYSCEVSSAEESAVRKTTALLRKGLDRAAEEFRLEHLRAGYSLWVGDLTFFLTPGTTSPILMLTALVALVPEEETNHYFTPLELIRRELTRAVIEVRTSISSSLCNSERRLR